MRVSRAAVLVPLLVLAAGGVAAVLVAPESRWNLPILGVLIIFSVLGDYLEVQARALTISGSAWPSGWRWCCSARYRPSWSRSSPRSSTPSVTVPRCLRPDELRASRRIPCWAP